MWAYFNGMKLGLARSGKLTDNPVNESFNDRLR